MTTRSLAALALTATVIVGAGPAVAQTSNYKSPTRGAWTVGNLFERTAGGSMTISKSSGKVTALRVVPGERTKKECGTAAVVLRKAQTIKRLGTAKRPAVGTVKKGKTLIEPTAASFTYQGKPTNGTLLIVFEMDGKSAFTAIAEVEECYLSFVLRKKK